MRGKGKGERSVADLLKNLARKCAALTDDAKELARKIENTNIVFFAPRTDPPKGLRALVMRDRMTEDSRAA